MRQVPPSDNPTLPHPLQVKMKGVISVSNVGNVNRARSGMSLVVARAGALQSEPPLPGARLLGGALCDEMGLGKTVVALALILKNPPPPQRLEGPGGAAARPVGRTLIAATPALMGQWVNEVLSQRA